MSRLIDADRLLSDRMKRMYYHLPNGDTAIPIIDIEHAPTIDAVPRQKYEEDMENAFAHGYTDAESNFRKMIADGELVEVVRCKDCKHFHYDMPYVIQGIPVLGHEVCDFWGDGCKTSENGFCSYAERRTDE